MNARINSLSLTSKKKAFLSEQNICKTLASERFGKRIFGLKTMEKILPKDVFRHVRDAIAGKEKLKCEYADIIAMAMKEWAMDNGATHYSHWFQPLTGATAEKQDAFIDWNGPGQLLEQFD